MSTSATTKISRLPSARRAMRSTLAASLCVGIAMPGFATTPLADQPLFSNSTVPGNVALALSVEYPTAIRTAHTAAYNPAAEFLGYFDPNKCYTYNNGADDNNRYFIPSGTASSHVCSNKWSGNFLNWATMQTIDPFRWALTGGYRFRDETTLTVLERAWQSGQANDLSPNKTLPAGFVSGATPFGNASSLKIRVASLRNKFRFTNSGTTGAVDGTNPTHFDNTATDGTLFEAFARVKVCDPSSAAGGVETNCKQYGSNWKPEGLIQQYASRMRFSAFGYMNQQDGNNRDGGVLRARQKFVGPTQPVPGLPAVTNTNSEWSATTGVFERNPDPTDASSTNTDFGPNVPVANSGVMNYLNKFGQITPGDYRSNDPVSELYYAALRYFRNLGNVPEWTNVGGLPPATITQRLDGFPVITNWDDPILYSCQRNFVLGIGDVYTHADKNVPGNSNTANEPAMPARVSGDTAVNAVTATNRVGVMQNLGGSYGTTTNINGCCSNNAGLMSGLAYWANTQDIRTDMANKQTVKTYWVDVLEKPFSPNNQFYLAAKYGGFDVPDVYDFNRTTPLEQAWWAKTADTVGEGGTQQVRPDNYFTAGRPDLMVTGLNKVFASIAAQLRAYTTSFAVPAPQVESTGGFSYSSRYDSTNWTGEVTSSAVTFDANTGQPTTTILWNFSEKLATQLAGDGWNTGRRMVTRNTDTNTSVPFRAGNLAGSQLTSLDTAYRTGNDGVDYLNYLRGERTYETDSTVAENRFYRARTSLVGDIVGSKARPIGPPVLNLSETVNPGYSNFKRAYAARPTVVYAGSNAGVLHAIRGSTAAGGAGDGTELFAYVPGALFGGPTGTPAINGLAALGNPSFLHHYYVNATPQVFDVDLNRTGGNTTATTSDWRSLLVGGLGKGGRSYYAIDVTDPSGMTSETAVASKVLWEFTDPDLGFTFGEPALVKTRKYGWVVIFVSGYNNTDGRGYFFFVNPRTGALLEKVSTGVGTPTASAGLAHVNTYVNDRADATADAAYAGDLQGNVWRVDLRPTTGNYAAPTLIAKVTDASGGAQPITSRPRIEISAAFKRYILFGTGRLLEDADIRSTQEQSFYAINDGTYTRFNETAADLPVRRSRLTANNNLLTGASGGEADALGWYTNLGRSTSNIGWRVISDPAVFAASDLVAFASVLPNGDACNPAGFSRVYAVNYGTGLSALTQSATNSSLIPYAEFNGAVTDINFLSQGGSGAGKTRLIVGTDQGEVKSLPGNFGRPTSLRVLNWRELKVTN